MRHKSDTNSLLQILQAISNHKLLIVFMFFLIVGIGMIATLLITPKYEATMSILYTRDRVESQISATERPSDSSQIIISDEEFNSELELIKSSEVISGVVSELNLINNQIPKNDSKLSKLRTDIKLSIDKLLGKGADENKNVPQEDFSVEKMTNRVANNLSIVPIKKSRVIKVTYTDTDPSRAKKTLESIYQRYSDLRSKLNDKSKVKEGAKADEVFSDLSVNYGQKLKSSTNNLKKFDTDNELSGTEMGTQKELLLNQTFETQNQLDSSTREIVETQLRVADLQEKIKLQPEQIQTSSVSKYVSALDKMKEELLQLEQQKTQIAQKYQPKSRPVIENQERIEKLKKTIAEEAKNPPLEKSFALNDLRRKLETELFSSQNNLVALKERQKQLTPMLSKLREQVTTLNSRSIERDGLERDNKINEEAYLLYEKKQRETEIGQILNKDKSLNFSLVEPPRTDGEAKNPKPFLNLIVLIFLGTICGFAGAIAIEKLTFGNDEEFISSGIEIEQRLNLPLLATIPVIRLSTTEKQYSTANLLLSAPEISKKKNKRFQRSGNTSSKFKTIYQSLNPFSRRKQNY